MSKKLSPVPKSPLRAGNDSLTDNDTVNFVAGMQISLSGSTQIKTLGKSGSDLLLGFGQNSSIKITGAKSTDTLKVVGAGGAVTLLADTFDLDDSLTFNSNNYSVKVAKNFFVFLFRVTIFIWLALHFQMSRLLTPTTSQTKLLYPATIKTVTIYAISR